MNIDQLRETLKTGTVQQQREAAEALVQLGESAIKAAVELVNAADCEDEIICEYANAALENIGQPHTTELSKFVEIIKNCQPTKISTAYWAATMIGRIGKDAHPALETLAQVAQQHSDVQVKKRIMWAIEKIGPNDSVIPFLTTTAQNENPGLARFAARVLEEFDRKAS